jgi:dephospho-CoA kinase
MNRLIVITGAPGSGKTYIGKLVAKLIGFEYLDFDWDINVRIANNQSLIEKRGMEEFLKVIREERYQDFINLVSDLLKNNKNLVITAPFTLELESKLLWDSCFAQVYQLGIEPVLIWIFSTPEKRLQRIQKRNSVRDSEKNLQEFVQTDSHANPKIPHIFYNNENDVVDLEDLIRQLKK